MDKKKELKEGLERLIEYIEKASVSVRQDEINITHGHDTGVCEDDYSRETHFNNGDVSINISVNLYDHDMDEAHKVHIPQLSREEK